MLDFAGANTDAQRTKRSVGRGVRVATDDGQSRHGQAKLRANHVHDALVLVSQRVNANAKFCGVVAQRLNLSS